MNARSRTVLLVAAATYVIVALLHFGVLTTGFEHRQAGTAESLIAAVLLVGLALTWTHLASARTIGLAAQGIALAGTLVGVFTIAIGVGPRTVPDIAYHTAIIAVLVGGLILARRAPRQSFTPPTRMPPIKQRWKANKTAIIG